MAVPISSHLERLPLDSLYNMRDLGGIPLAGGGHTAYGRFLRSDETAKLSDTDLESLRAYPVKLVIDLRTIGEIQQQPSRLANVDGMQYVHISLLGEDLDKEIATIVSNDPGRAETNLGDIYIHMLKHFGQEIGHVLTLMAGQTDGALIFHCAHGKDRTGLIAMLLLKLAGASDEDIIENYAISYHLLLPWFKTFWHGVPARLRAFFNTDRQNMEETLVFFNSHYENANQYLTLNGVSIETIGLLRRRLIAD